MQTMSKVPVKGDTTFSSLAPANFSSSTKLSDFLRPLNIFKGTAAANAALAGTTIITVAFAVIQSVAIDQFIAIQTARPKLEVALAQAQQPVNLSQMVSQPNGTDLVLYFWAKAMESDREFEDPQMIRWAATSHQLEQANGYRLPDGK